MSQIQDSAFCQDCFAHISKASDILSECRDGHCRPEQYERIAFQFNDLMTDSRASRFVVLATFAQTMASYCRALANTPPSMISEYEQDLLHDGIDAGLACQRWTMNNKCVEQNFDQLWPFITKLRAKIDSTDSMIIY